MSAAAAEQPRPLQEVLDEHLAQVRAQRERAEAKRQLRAHFSKAGPAIAEVLAQHDDRDADR